MCFELLWKKTENEKEETKQKNKTGHPESDKGRIYFVCYGEEKATLCSKVLPRVKK